MKAGIQVTLFVDVEAEDLDEVFRRTMHAAAAGISKAPGMKLRRFGSYAVTACDEEWNLRSGLRVSGYQRKKTAND